MSLAMIVSLTLAFITMSTIVAFVGIIPAVQNTIINSPTAMQMNSTVWNTFNAFTPETLLLLIIITIAVLCFVVALLLKTPKETK